MWIYRRRECVAVLTGCSHNSIRTGQYKKRSQYIQFLSLDVDDMREKKNKKQEKENKKNKNKNKKRTRKQQKEELQQKTWR